MTQDTGLAQIRAKIDQMKSHVASSYAALHAIGVNPIGEPKLANLPQTIERLSAGTTVSCVINQIGSDYQLPSSQVERHELLTGAKVYVFDMNGVKLGEGTLAGLENQTVIVQVPNITDRTNIEITLHLGNTTYSALPVRTYLQPDRITTAYFTTAANLGVIEEVGRFQLFDDTTGTSYLIRRVTDAAGQMALHYGGFYLDQSGTAVWINHSGVFTTAEQCADESSDMTSTTINSCQDASARNLTSILKVFSEARPVTATSTDGDGESVENKLMQYTKFYCKTEKTSIPIVTYNEDGSISGTEMKDVVIKWMCDTKPDASYKIHPFFLRVVREESGSYTETELDHAFYSRYPMNWKSVKPTAGGSNVTVATCTADGICPSTALNRDTANSYARNLNKLSFVVTDDETGDVVAELAANEDARAWATSSSSDISFFQWICIMQYGIEIQGVIMGRCNTDTTTCPQTKNGDTDWLFAKGVRWGSKNRASNTEPCLIAGIEDGIHSSQGTFMEDLTYFAERVIDGDGNESKKAYLVYARDRLDWTPQQGNLDTLLSRGYQILPLELNSNTDANTTISNVKKRIGYVDANANTRAMMIPCADQSQPNFQEGAIDNFWFGATPAVGTAGKSAYLVALGNYRIVGRSLGLFTVGANSALSNASANAWRPRLSLQVVGA